MCHASRLTVILSSLKKEARRQDAKGKHSQWANKIIKDKMTMLEKEQRNSWIRLQYVKLWKDQSNFVISREDSSSWYTALTNLCGINAIYVAYNAVNLSP